MIGRTLAHYTVTAKIGEGGMGEVFRATDSRLKRDVALKVLPAAVAKDSTRLARFQREAEAVAALNHPSIITIHSVEEAEGVHLLVMELVEGKSLNALIPPEGFRLTDLLQIGIPLADALGAAHEAGIVHRDLKPANVMLTQQGLVKVLDFGLAKTAAADPEAAEPQNPDVTRALTEAALTGEGMLLGTVPYMAPEQLQGKAVDARTDLFALGAVLHELATGSAPFQGESIPAIASSILRDQPPLLLEARPDLPADLGRIVRRCLEKDPERRFQTAKDVRNELEDLRLYPPTASPPDRGSRDRLLEGSFTVTPDHVRGLTQRIPRMVGEALEYVDNGVDSDVLVVFLHGAGGDHQDFLPVLPEMTCRGVSVSLFGFGPAARLRPALPLEDHHRLLRLLVQDLDRRLHPRKRILVGFSSGADQWMRMLASPQGAGLDPDAVLLLSPNVGLESAYVNRAFAGLTDDPGDILETFRSFGNDVESLRMWLNMQDYIVRILQKFGTDMEILRRFGKDIVAPFHEDPEAHLAWFRNAVDSVPRVRFVFAEEEEAEGEAVMARHLDSNVLGDRFTEDTIQFARVSHVELPSPDVTLPLIQDLVERTR